MQQEFYRLNVFWAGENLYNLTSLDFEEPSNIITFRKHLSTCFFVLKVSKDGIPSERMDQIISYIETAVENDDSLKKLEPLRVTNLRITEYDPEFAVSNSLPNKHKQKIPGNAWPTRPGRRVDYAIASSYLQRHEEAISDENLSILMEYIVRLCRLLRVSIGAIEVPRKKVDDLFEVQFGHRDGRSIITARSPYSSLNESTQWIKELKDLYENYEGNPEEKFRDYPVRVNPFPKRRESESNNCSLL